MIDYLPDSPLVWNQRDPFWVIMRIAGARGPSRALTIATAGVARSTPAGPPDPLKSDARLTIRWGFDIQ